MTQRVCRKRKGKRLAYYQETASPEFWDAHWAKGLDKNNYERHLNGYLGVHEKPFRKYLPKDGRILEAGCGLGRVVMALRANGYRCEGVEFGVKTVERVLQLFPDLPIRVGDVTRLDVPDNFYSGYISLGVIEHLESGPEPFLREAKRILRPGGIAYFSVPYINLIRKLKLKLNYYNEEPTSDQEFYQYAFCSNEMFSILEDNGFHVIGLHGHVSWKGIEDEIPLFQKIDDIPKVGGAYRILTRTIPFCDRYLGHMLGFICKT